MPQLLALVPALAPAGELTGERHGKRRIGQAAGVDVETSGSSRAPSPRRQRVREGCRDPYATGPSSLMSNALLESETGEQTLRDVHPYVIMNHVDFLSYIRRTVSSVHH